MALELSIFLVILGASALLYASGLLLKMPHLFLFGCVLLFGSGALLWGSNGLILENNATTWSDVTNSWTYVATIIDMTNIGLAMFAFVLVGIPIISALTIDINPSSEKHKSPYHY